MTADGISLSLCPNVVKIEIVEVITVTQSFHPVHHFTDAIQYFANLRDLKIAHFFILSSSDISNMPHKFQQWRALP
jgi:hypothetical protein